MKLFLILMSLCIIYKGVMDTGDPSGFYSSTAVFYSMLLLDYYTQAHLFKSGFIKAARLIMMFLSGISILGVFGILSIREIEGEFFVTFSKTMRLGNDGILNVHWLFLILSTVAVVMVALEWVFSIDKEASGQTGQKYEKKGA